MFDTFYSFIHKGSFTNHDEGDFILKHIYSFKDSKSTTYLFEAHKYEHNFFAIKFYDKNNRLSDYKYNLLTNNFNQNAVLSTAVKIMLDMWEKDKSRSFGFYGAPKYAKVNKHYQNLESGVTSRKRTYSSLISMLISNTNFDHYDDPSNNIYLLLSKRNTTKNLYKKVIKEVVARFNFP